MARLEWYGPQPLGESDIIAVIEERPGVYRIMVFERGGHPRPITRLGGTDPLGIIHIGESKNLATRISAFRRIVTRGVPNSHHAANEFVEWGFSKRLPVELLHFDYAYTKSKKEAVAVEAELHGEYRRKYLDRPPLDGRGGQRTYE